MASFKDKVDYFNLTANSAPLEVLSDDSGIENSFNEYVNQDGEIVDSVSYGEKKSPKNDLALTGDWAISAGAFKLGGVSTVGSEKFALGELNIETTAGELPTLNCSGIEVPSDSATSHYFAVPAATVKNDETAQILWGAFELSGDGCYLQSAKYKLAAELPTRDKDGVPLCFGVAKGAIECVIEIVQCGTAEPTVEAGDDWVVSKVPACSNPDSDVPIWSCTLRMPLSKTVPIAST